MTRESRIEKARQMATETAEERAAQRESEDAARSDEIASMGTSQASSEATKLTQDSSISYLGPIATPHEWKQALEAARDVVVEVARRRGTLTYAELQIAAVRASGRKIGHSMYGTFCMELNHPGQDGCLISSIIVGSDSGEPGPGLLPFAEDVGLDKTVAELQADVYRAYGHR